LKVKRIKAAFFDWEGTLAVWGENSERNIRLQNLLRASRIHIEQHDLELALAKLKVRGPNPNTRQGVLAWYQALLDYAGVPKYDSVVLETLRNEYANQSFNLIRGVLEVLELFREQQIAVGIITNHSALVRKEIVHTLGNYVSSIVISDEVGVEKPNPAVFAYAAQSLGLMPIECAHIGDDLEIDAVGAQHHGGFAAGIWLNPVEKRPCPYRRNGLWVVKGLHEAFELLTGVFLTAG
jgi:HAD superfamily hydrolase (TIGR01549 family)